jgi:hydrogenase nickel incorporation protein HypA/HybF
MHELSIVMSIIDIAEEQVRKAQAKHVDCVELEVGTMAGIEMDALNFSWQVATKNTLLDGAELQVDRVQAIGRCSNCQHEFPIQERFEPCPICNELLIDYLFGKELKVKSLVVS